MLKSRRHFLANGAAYAVGVPLGCSFAPLTALAQDTAEEDILCGTDETLVGTGLEITDFAAGDDPFDPARAMAEFKITPFGTAMQRSRWRKSDGLTPNTGLITLGCFFLSGSPQERSTVEAAAQGWLRGGVERQIRFDFTVSQANSQIRIVIPGNGNNSQIGRTALRVRKDQPTMHLVTIQPGTIQHEFGHALGLLHEHMHPGFDAPLDEARIIEDMRQPPNRWDEAKTRHNIIRRLGSDAKCVGDPAMNPHSIMMYNIPKRWTLNGQSFRRGDAIQDRDIACVRGIYS